MQATKRWFLTAGFVFFLSACSSQGSGIDITISGSVNRDLSQADVYYEGTPAGRQLYIEKHGPGGDIQVLTLELPADIAPGTYTITSSGFVSAAYFEFVDGVSSQFERNVSGTVSIVETDSAFTGQMDFYATAPFGQDSIHVVDTFEDIPYGAEGGSTGSIMGAVIICGLVMLVLINFVL